MNLEELRTRDIEAGKKIKADFELALIGFKDIDDPKNIEIGKQFVDKFEKYIESCVCLYTLHFLYGDIARAYLHAREQEKAESYAVAYYRLNKKSGDKEGERYALISIIDTQVVKENYRISYYLCTEYLKQEKRSKTYKNVKVWLEKKLKSEHTEINLKQFAAETKEFFANTQMPELFKTLNNERTMMKETKERANRKIISSDLTEK